MKKLGKIESAEFGKIPDRDFMFGLRLYFAFGDSTGVGDGGQYTLNMSPDAQWNNSEERRRSLELLLTKVVEILTEAKVNTVSELINIPVEVEMENNHFKDFRILKEVL